LLIGAAVVLALLVVSYLWMAYRPTGFNRTQVQSTERVAELIPAIKPKPRAPVAIPLPKAAETVTQRLEAALPPRERQSVLSAAKASRSFWTMINPSGDSTEPNAVAVAGRRIARDVVLQALRRVIFHNQLEAISPVTPDPRAFACADTIARELRERGPPETPDYAGMEEMSLGNVSIESPGAIPLASLSIAILRTRHQGEVEESDRLLAEAAQQAMNYHRGIGGNSLYGQNPAGDFSQLLPLAHHIAPIAESTLDRLDRIVAEGELTEAAYAALCEAEILRRAARLKENALKLSIHNSPWLYFMDSIPHNVVRKAAVPVYRRRVEDLALAIVSQDPDAMEIATGNLEKVLRVMNVEARARDMFGSPNAYGAENPAIRALIPHAPTRMERYHLPLWRIRAMIGAIRHHQQNGSWPASSDDLASAGQRLGTLWNWTIIQTGPLRYTDKEAVNSNADMYNALVEFYRTTSRHPESAQDFAPGNPSPEFIAEFDRVFPPAPTMTVIVFLSAAEGIHLTQLNEEPSHPYMESFITPYTRSISTARLSQLARESSRYPIVIHAVALSDPRTEEAIRDLLGDSTAKPP